MQRPALDMEALAAENSMLRKKLADRDAADARQDDPPQRVVLKIPDWAKPWVGCLVVIIGVAALATAYSREMVREAAAEPIACYQVEAPSRPFASYVLVGVRNHGYAGTTVGSFGSIAEVGKYLDDHHLRGELCIR